MARAQGAAAPIRVRLATLLGRTLRRSALKKIIQGGRSDRHDPELFCLANDSIGNEVIVSGRYEGAFIDLLRELVEVHRHPLAGEGEGRSTILDIGANIGSHAINFARFADHVLCFEPNPAVYHVCVANIKHNQIDNIDAYEVALSDHEGVSTLYVPRSTSNGTKSEINLGSSTIAGPLAADAKAIPVEVRQGDRFLKDHLAVDDHVVLIKIDVEGHEMEVIQGLSQTIVLHRPIIAFEAKTVAEARSVVSTLKSLGYHKYFVLQRSWTQFHDTKLKVNIIKNLLPLFYSGLHYEMVELSLDQEGYFEMIVALPVSEAVASHDEATTIDQ